MNCRELQAPVTNANAGRIVIAASVAGSVLWGRFKTTGLGLSKHQRRKKESSQGAW